MLYDPELRHQGRPLMLQRCFQCQTPYRRMQSVHHSRNETRPGSSSRLLEVFHGRFHRSWIETQKKRSPKLV